MTLRLLDLATGDDLWSISGSSEGKPGKSHCGDAPPVSQPDQQAASKHGAATDGGNGPWSFCRRRVLNYEKESWQWREKTMFYGLRDESDKLIAIGERPLSPQWQPLDESSPELKQFLGAQQHNLQGQGLQKQEQQGQKQQGQEQQALAESDAQLVRVLDDVIELLIEKQVFLFTELPQAAQDKLLKRRWYRQQLSGKNDTTHLIDPQEGLI